MNSLKKHIEIIKEESERKEISRVIVESRIRELIGGPDFFDRFNNLSEDKKATVAFQLFTELNNLDSYGLIEESDLWTGLKNLFGGLTGMMGSGIETLAEPIVSKALQYIGFDPNWYWSKVIVSYLTTNPAELIRSFTSCEKFSLLLAKSIIEAFTMELQSQSNVTNNVVVSFMRNAIGNSLQGYTDELGGELSKTLCKFFDKLTSNVSSLTTKLSGGS